MTLSILGMTGCMSINEDISNDVKNILSNKYHCEFEVHKIGNRLNRDDVTLYCTPKNDATLYFTAEYNRDTKTLFDNYIFKSISRKVGTVIEKNFNIRSFSSVNLMGADNINEINYDIALDEFVVQCKPKSYFMYLILNEDDIKNSGSDILKAFQKSYEELAYAKLVAMIFIIPDDRFDECKDEMIKNPGLSSTWFDDYSIKTNLNLSIDSKGASMTVDELDSILERK